MVRVMTLQTVMIFLKMPVLALSLSHTFFGGILSLLNGENA